MCNENESETNVASSTAVDKADPTVGDSLIHVAVDNPSLPLSDPAGSEQEESACLLTKESVGPASGDSLGHSLEEPGVLKPGKSEIQTNDNIRGSIAVVCESQKIVEIDIESVGPASGYASEPLLEEPGVLKSGPSEFKMNEDIRDSIAADSTSLTLVEIDIETCSDIGSKTENGPDDQTAAVPKDREQKKHKNKMWKRVKRVSLRLISWCRPNYIL